MIKVVHPNFNLQLLLELENMQENEITKKILDKSFKEKISQKFLDEQFGYFFLKQIFQSSIYYYE